MAVVKEYFIKRGTFVVVNHCLEERAYQYLIPLKLFKNPSKPIQGFDSSYSGVYQARFDLVIKGEVWQNTPKTFSVSEHMVLRNNIYEHIRDAVPSKSLEDIDYSRVDPSLYKDQALKDYLEKGGAEITSLTGSKYPLHLKDEIAVPVDDSVTTGKWYILKKSDIPAYC